MPAPHGARQPGSPGRIPLVYGQAEHQHGIASHVWPGYPAQQLEGESTSMRIRVGGLEYRQGQYIHPGATHITYNVTFDASEYDTRRSEGDFRSLKVTMPIGTSARDVAFNLERAMADIAARPRGDTNLRGR